MKIIDLIKNIDKSDQNKNYVNIHDFAYEQFSLSLDHNVINKNLKCYWLGRWLCTDSYVGYRVYFLNDEAVGISLQEGRKCSENMYWISKEAAIKTKEYILSLMVEEVEDNDYIICDINEDLGDSFKISFNDQIIDMDKATYKNEKVEIVEFIRKEKYYIDNELKIKLQNGNVIKVCAEDLDFKYNLKDDK